MSIPVVTVGDSTDALVGELEALHGPITVVRRCAELTELIAVCQSGLARAAIVAEGLEELSASLIDRLSLAGVLVIALTDDPFQMDRLGGFGVLVADSQAEADSLSRQIAAALLPAGTAVRQRDGLHPGYADPAAIQSNLPLTDEAIAEPADQAHRLLAVWGPIGSPGRTTVAVNLAAELAALGQTVLLIDADSYGASVAATLGLLDESAAIAQACRLADQGILDQEALRRIAPEVVFRGGTFRVLSGLTRADRWSELRAAALSRVLDLAKTLCDVTIVDCGFSLESDEELSFDTVAPRRNAATLTVLAEADEVFAVGAADSIGMPRLVRALQELDAVAPAQRVTVVLNKVRASAAGRRPELALQQAWERFGPGLSVRHFLPWDPQSLDKALLAGEVLLEVAPEAELRHRIVKLVSADAQGIGKIAMPTNTARRRVSG